MITFVRSIVFGPELYCHYDVPRESALTLNYKPNAFERYGNTGLTWIRVTRKLMVYTSPFLLGYLYRRQWFTPEGFHSSLNILAVVMVFYAAGLTCRSIGRVMNPMYIDFTAQLNRARVNLTEANKATLMNYDFDFSHWPVEFNMAGSYGDQRSNSSSTIKGFEVDREVSLLMKLPVRVTSWLMANTFGISLVYPGSIELVQANFAPFLREGRYKLIKKNNGVRYKLKTVDSNEIDVIYLQKGSSKGSTLVITCEGNGGFYEIGIASAPLEAGYSILGWNHPGFAGSSGSPFPSQETNAADAVMQFAVRKLGYEPENILIYGWSIGGFTSSWMAMNYPDIKGVILDATFDHLLPLAIRQMPAILEPVVQTAVNEYINLNVTEQIIRYPGPVTLIRRRKDEMISLEQGDLRTNRGNFLLINLLKYRYPGAINEDLLWKYLSVSQVEQINLYTEFNVDDDSMNELLNDYTENNSKHYPLTIGEDTKDEETKDKLTLFLAKKYMVDVDTSHCTPLPGSHFVLPWREGQTEKERSSH